jgi:hypothetical protein
MVKRILILTVVGLCVGLSEAANIDKALSRKKAIEVQKEVIAEWKASERARLSYITAEQKVYVDTITMPIHWQTFGKKPADGRSLYISLHGGGNTTQKFNDSQWTNQWRLYTPNEGVYLCPRAPYNDWDMHFKPLLDECYRDVINYCVTYMDVNSDKVYLMGYSAGGDGVWRLAPRMADTWAAASMMAGHPGDVRLENLRNTPFTVWCGSEDSAYSRNRLDAERIAQLDSLQHDDPAGYIHFGRIVEGKPHWMDRVDTLAVEWMARYTRNPYPAKVVWRQEEQLKQAFYWLKVDSAEMARGKEVRASYDKDNKIVINKCDYSRLTLCLCDDMMNLDMPVTVIYGGKTIFKGKVRRTRRTMEKNLAQRRDERYAFPAEIKLQIR